MFTYFFFFKYTPTTEIYTLSLHDALPIWRLERALKVVEEDNTCSADSEREDQLADLVLPFGKNLRFNLFPGDRKSTRLNSSHTVISYAVFCLKKKKNKR